MLLALYRHAAIRFAKPYIRRELPGWGVLYRTLIGSYERDWLWREAGERWVRGKLHGYDMSVRMSGWSNRATFFLERFYDLPTQLFIQQVLKKGDLFIDVGANEGMMTLLASRLVGDTGRVISFEPNPIPAEILKRNLRRNAISNVELHDTGLGDVEGDLQLFVPHVNTGEGSFAVPEDASTGDYTVCPVRMGDAIVEGRMPRLIKIDVEGFEGRVLRGLRATLERAKPILVMEMIQGHLARDQVTPTKICEWLESLGYYGKRLGLRDRRNLQLSPVPEIWKDGDYIFVHRDKSLPPSLIADTVSC